MPEALPATPWPAVGALVAAMVVAGCSAPPPEQQELPEGVQGPEERTAPSVEPEPGPDVAPDDEVTLGSYAVSAGDETAVDAGIEILDAGGSAVDAAIAAALAVSVVEPFASGLGGGGATLVASPDGEVEAFDYREVVNQAGEIPASDTGVPGFVPGLGALHEAYGELAWEDLVAPAVALAEEATVSRILADQLRTGAGRLDTGSMPELYPGGSPLSEGDALTQPELADTLGTLASEGPESFTTGTLAERLDAELAGVDAASLAAYQVQRSDPPRGPFADLQVVGAAPPLPGAALVQLLQVAETLGVGDLDPATDEHIHAMMMAWRVADRSVDTVFGDPEFVDVPLEELTDPEANAEAAGQVPGDALLASASTAANTTHITTVGADGTVVSMTNTLTNFWGSGQRVAGFFLNDQMNRFSIGTDRNQPEPGRRSVSWSLPALVLDDQDRPVLGLGSPGGRRIPTIEANLLVRWALHGQTLQEAVDAPRVHLEGDTLQFEELPDEPTARALRDRGYALEVPAPVYYFGSVQALEVDHEAGEIRGAQDPRRAGAWRVSEAG